MGKFWNFYLRGTRIEIFFFLCGWDLIWEFSCVRMGWDGRPLSRIMWDLEESILVSWKTWIRLLLYKNWKKHPRLQRLFGFLFLRGGFKCFALVFFHGDDYVADENDVGHYGGGGAGVGWVAWRRGLGAVDDAWCFSSMSSTSSSGQDRGMARIHRSK